ncbi:MAG: TRAP transporter small permease subunit [Actinophytocola sp.]|nr:TRAP transporter small permease subunit [Actinophytocola sp.]
MPLRLIERISTWSGYLSAVLVLASMLIISYAAVLRYLVGASTIWQTELVTYLLMFAAFCGGAYGLQHGDQVKIDLVVTRLGPRTQRVVRLVAAILGCCFVAALAVMAFDMWWETTREGMTSGTAWDVPLTYPHLILPVGMTLLTLQYLVVIAAIIQEIRHGGAETATPESRHEREGIPT